MRFWVLHKLMPQYYHNKLSKTYKTILRTSTVSLFSLHKHATIGHGATTATTLMWSSGLLLAREAINDLGLTWCIGWCLLSQA